MEKSYIGIRLADGRFFPIFDRDQARRKRLVLTTVKDDQESVQIDLYRGAGEEMAEPEYVATLVIQNVESARAGDPEISLVMGVDDQGNLNATAADEKSGEYESLSVSLEEQATETPGEFELTETDLADVEADVEADFEVPEQAEEPEESGGALDLDALDLGDTDLDAFTEPEPEPAPDSDEYQKEPAERSQESEFFDASEMPALPEEEELGGEEAVEAASELEDFSFPDEDDVDLGDLNFEEEFGVESSEEPAADESSAGATEFGETDFDAAGLGEPDLGDEFPEPELPDESYGSEEPEGEVPEQWTAEEEPLDAEPLPVGPGSVIVFIAFMILSLAGLGLLTYLVFQALRGPDLPPLLAGFVTQARALLASALALL